MLFTAIVIKLVNTNAQNLQDKPLTNLIMKSDFYFCLIKTINTKI